MPYSNNSGGPWGGGNRGKGSGNGDDGGEGKNPWGQGGRGQRPGGSGQVPDIDEMLRRGSEQLKVLVGGKGGSGGPGFPGSGGIGKGGVALIFVAAIGFWLFNSLYSVQPNQQSVVLRFGEYARTGNPGLNFALWPIETYEIIDTTGQRTESIGVNANSRSEEGLMLTGDENIVDIDFQVVWNISDPARFIFNIAEPEETVRAVSESAMREVIGRSLLAPILNRDRAVIAQEVSALIQSTLDSYESGINIVRLNFDRADPPKEVIDAFRDVQAAEQERDTLERRADAYSNEKLAEARGESAQLLQEAEAYRAQVVNEAQGEAARFNSIYEEYAKAEDVTRKRLYLETLERVLSATDKIIIDDNVGGGGGQGVVPYLPLNELRRSQEGN